MCCFLSHRQTITGNGQNGLSGNNNNFGSDCELCSNYYHGNHPTNYQKTRAWYCVDLSELHAVRAVRWQAKQVVPKQNPFLKGVNTVQLLQHREELVTG